MARIKTTMVKLQLRLCPETHLRLAQAAADNRYSLNHEIVQRLEKSLVVEVMVEDIRQVIRETIEQAQVKQVKSKWWSFGS